MNPPAPYQLLESAQSHRPQTRRGFLGNAILWVIGTTGSASLTAVAATKKAPWDSRFQLNIEFQINDPEGGRYNRPFVAVWIEDEDGQTVRTLCLWVQQTVKGARWISDLKQWFRDEDKRRARDGGDLIQSLSSATRVPGKYDLAWNGRSDAGKTVSQGNYTLCIESARENGTYQIIKTALPIGGAAFQKSLLGNVEIKAVKVDYKRK